MFPRFIFMHSLLIYLFIYFLDVIIVIEPVEIEEKTFYRFAMHSQIFYIITKLIFTSNRMEVACKNGVPPFGPQLLQPLFSKDDYFRDFIFAKRKSSLSLSLPPFRLYSFPH